MSVETEEDVECLVNDTERQELLDEIADEVGLKHPITFDVYDLCEYYHHKKLSAFNVQMLKNILSHLEVPFKSKDKKSILISKLREVIGACKCDAILYDLTVIYFIYLILLLTKKKLAKLKGKQLGRINNE